MAAQPYGTGVYWVGQDGNTYMKASGLNGVTQWQAPLLSPTQAGLTQIADPTVASSAPSNPTGASTPALDTAAVHNTQASIDQLPALLQAALANEDTSYGNTTAGYDASQHQQQDQYDKSTTTNQQNYDANFMDSIRAGIKGLHGLFQILRGTGADGGTADANVRDIVGATTAGDIRTGADTRDQNQGQLDTTLAQFLTDLKQKRQAAADTHANNAAAIRRDNATNLQDLYSKMAGFYGQAGNTAAANDWMTRAGSLTPEIASNSRATTSRYDTTPVVVHAPNLTAFAAPSQPQVATAPQDGQVGSGIFALTPPNNRKADQTQTPQLAGA